MRLTGWFRRSSRANAPALAVSGCTQRLWISGWPRPLLALVLFALLAARPAPSDAQTWGEATPSEKIGTAALLTPAQVDAFYGTATTSTNGLGFTKRPPEVVELARSLAGNSAPDPSNPTDLHKTVDRIYQYVQNNIEMVWVYGLQKGAVGAIVDHSGTAFDQAMLMVELLRQDNYTAGYQVGEITLDAQQFYDWSGVQNAQAACQMLSSGSIGAIINGVSDPTCSGTSYTGNVNSITLNHIWVTVVIGGTTYLFDPAFKVHVHNSSANLPTFAGFTPGDPLSAAETNMTSGTDSGTHVAYVQSLNEAALDTTIQGYGENLLTYIRANPQLHIQDIVGIDVIQRYTTPQGGLRQTSLPYVSSVTFNWSGGVPDQYRTTLGVEEQVWEPSGSGQMVTMWNKSLFVDETYGRKLTVASTFDPIASPNSWTAQLNLTDETGAGVGGVPATLASYTGANPLLERTTNVILAVNHPYAASADGSATTHGDYMDATITKMVDATLSFTIVNAWGDSNGLIAQWSDRVDTGIRPDLRGSLCDTCSPPPEENQGDGKREQFAAEWIVQSSMAARTHAAIANGVYQLHHAVGIVASDIQVLGYSQYAVQLWATGQVWTGPIYDHIKNKFDRIDIDSGFSFTSKTADLYRRRAAVLAIAATTDALEGSVVAQAMDVPDTTSTATRFEWGNAPPPSEDVYGGGVARRFFTFTSANSSAAATLALVEGKNYNTAPDPCGSTSSEYYGEFEYAPTANPSPNICSAEGDAWTAALGGAVTAYAQAGFNVVTTEESHLGPGQPFGAQDVDAVTDASTLLYRTEPSLQRGGALVAVQYSTAGDPLQIAHITFSLLNGSGQPLLSKGGGAGVQTDNTSTYNPGLAADVLKARFVDRSTALGVDIATGDPTYAPASTLTVGSGDFPYSLSANYLWRGGGGPFTNETPQAQPSQPWTTSWNNMASVGGSGIESLGATDPRAAAGTIGAFLAMQDIFHSSPSTPRDVAGVLANAWWVRQLTGTLITTSIGATTRQFIQLVDGSFLGLGAGPYATLAQTGTRVAGNLTCAVPQPPYLMSRGWIYTNVSFAVTNAQGDVQSFPYWMEDQYPYSPSACRVLSGFRLSSWTFPQGVDVTLSYGPPDINEGVDPLLSVSNSLGRQINFINSGLVRIDITPSGFNNNLTGSDARAVSLSMMSDVTNPYLAYTFTDPNGGLTYALVDPIPWYNDFHYLLDYVYTPDNPPVGVVAYQNTQPSNPASLEYAYDSLRRVMTAWDDNALQLNNRQPYSFYISDHVRGERMDPMGASYAVEYDIWKQPIQYFDEIGRETQATHDAIGRVSSYTYPEGDQEQFTYDSHNNPASLTKIPVPGSLLPDIAIRANWDPSWNKPLTIVDARGNSTTFVYYPTGQTGTSMLETATRPPDIHGQQPVYSFTYTSFGRIATSTDPTNVVTQNGYDGSGDLNSVTLDPSGVNSLTQYGYDANGEQTSETDPNGNVSNFTYDLDRRRIFDIAADPDGSGPLLRPATKQVYDAEGRVVITHKGRTTQPDGSDFTALETSSFLYDPVGNRLQTTTHATLTQYSYDNDNRQTCTAVRMNALAYGQLPPTACTPGPAGAYGADRITETNFDPAGQTTSTIRALGDPLQQSYETFTYGLDGEKATVTDALGNQTCYQYDGFIRLAYTQFPSTVAGSLTCDPTDQEGYTYDPNGNRLTLSKRDGLKTITYTYDNLNREEEKDDPPGLGQSGPDILTFTDYDLAGRTLHVRFTSLAGQGVDYGYDTAGRLKSESTYAQAMAQSLTLTYQYDQAGNRIRVTWPDAFYAGYDFDFDNRVNAVNENGATGGIGALAAITYDDLGRRIGLARGNGTSTAYDYDLDDRLASLGQTFASTSGSSDTTWYFTYNPADQKVVRNASTSVFEWTSYVEGANATQTYDGLNRNAGLAATPGGYDTDGNLTSDGTRAFTYDVENRLLSASAPTAVALAYDPLGRLNTTTAGGTATQFLYSGEDLVAEYVSGALTARYVQGPETDEALVWYDGSAHRFLHADPQGSIVAWSDASGNVTSSQIYTYGPYGEPAAWGGSRFQYTGQIEVPEAQLDYYKARVYDPMVGRFLQTDPVGYTSDVNLYAYVGNDPTNKADPTGDDAAQVLLGVAEVLVGGTGAVAGGAGVAGGVVVTVGTAGTAVVIAGPEVAFSGAVAVGSAALFGRGLTNIEQGLRPSGATTSEARNSNRGNQGQGERKYDRQNPNPTGKPNKGLKAVFGQPGMTQPIDPQTGSNKGNPRPAKPNEPGYVKPKQDPSPQPKKKDDNSGF